jgi:hypothetical protein
MAKAPQKPDDEEYVTIFVAYITTRSGKRIYAFEKGLKAFPIRVKRKGNGNSSKST